MGLDLSGGYPLVRGQTVVRESLRGALMRSVRGWLAGAMLATRLLVPSQAAAQDELPICGDLLEQARAHLQGNDYPSMFEVAKEREASCPGPTSSFLVGLSLAYLLDGKQIEASQWEESRDRALKALRGAAAGDLREGWRTTAAEWVVHLENMRAPVKPKDPAAEPAAQVALEKPFPWGPVIVGSVSLAIFAGAGTVGLAAMLKDNALMDRLNEACTQMGGQITCPEMIDNKPTQEFAVDGQKEVGDYYTLNSILLVAGGVTALGAGIWFIVWALEDPQPVEEASAFSVTPQMGFASGEPWGLQLQGNF